MLWSWSAVAMWYAFVNIHAEPSQRPLELCASCFLEYGDFFTVKEKDTTFRKSSCKTNSARCSHKATRMDCRRQTKGASQTTPWSRVQVLVLSSAVPGQSRRRQAAARACNGSSNGLAAKCSRENFLFKDKISADGLSAERQPSQLLPFSQ